jgi:hypothetical protein
LPERCYTTEIRDIFLNRQRFVVARELAIQIRTPAGHPKKFEFVDSVDNS